MAILICDPREPERIAEALKLVAILVRGDRAEMAKFPLCGKGPNEQGYYQALQATAAHEDMYWMQVAREQWLVLAFEKWTAWAEANVDNLPKIVNFRRQVPRDEVDGADYNLVTQYLNPAQVLESHKLMDQFLTVLVRFNCNWGTDNRREIVELLQRRTGCSRQNDPHKNELAFKLLLAHYGLS